MWLVCISLRYGGDAKIFPRWLITFWIFTTGSTMATLVPSRSTCCVCYRATSGLATSASSTTSSSVYVILGSEDEVCNELLSPGPDCLTAEILPGGPVSLKEVTRQAVREL